MTTFDTLTLSDEQAEAIKTRQQATWSSGDYAAIGTTLQLTGELLCESTGIEAGQRVLDVAAGNGNAALAAARRNADVTASDYVAGLLAQAAERARAEGTTIHIREADAEALPFADDSFDAVLSVFGVMFTPRQQVAAAELVRVGRPGGHIGLVSWTPDSFVAAMFATVARHVPPPPVPSVFGWGDRSTVLALLGDGVQVVRNTVRTHHFRYRSADHMVSTFRRYYGPTFKAFAALDAEGQDALEFDLVELVRTHNSATGDAVAVPSTYLELVARVR